MPLLSEDCKKSITEQPQSSDHTTVPIDTLVSQLSTGRVKLSLGELRQSANTTIKVGSDYDDEEIFLPLQEILPRLNNRLYQRRSDQKEVTVPDNVKPVFGLSGAITPPSKPLSDPVAPAAQPPSPSSPPSTDDRSNDRGPREEKIKLAPTDSMIGHLNPEPASKPQPSPVEKEAPEPETLTVPLSEIASNFPPELETIIVRGLKRGTDLHLPTAVVAKKLATGKIGYTWKELNDCSKPPLSEDREIPDDTAITLPVSVIAPLFIAYRQSVWAKNTPTPGVNIPDVFVSKQSRSEPPADTIAMPQTRSILAPDSSEPKITPEPTAVPQSPKQETSTPSILAPKLENPTIALKMADTPELPSTPEPPSALKMPATPELPSAPKPATTPDSGGQKTFDIAFDTVSSTWPETVRAAISQGGQRSTLSIPANELEEKLKTGRASFSWKQLKIWAKPAIEETTPIPDDTELSLPLEVVAPLFLGNRPSSIPAAPTPEMDSIPDTFTSKKTAQHQPPAPPAPAAPPVVKPPQTPPSPTSQPESQVTLPTGEASRSDTRDLPKAETLGQILGQKENQHWLPGKIVKRLTSLPGIAGALIVTKDGLQVASHLEPDQSGDVLAGFIPQLYERAKSYTKEFHFGDSDQIMLIINQRQLMLTKTGSVYFAVFSQSGEALPERKLKIVANHLGKAA